MRRARGQRERESEERERGWGTAGLGSGWAGERLGSGWGAAGGRLESGWGAAGERLGSGWWGAAAGSTHFTERESEERARRASKAREEEVIWYLGSLEMASFSLPLRGAYFRTSL